MDIETNNGSKNFRGKFIPTVQMINYNEIRIVNIDDPNSCLEIEINAQDTI